MDRIRTKCVAERVVGEPDRGYGGALRASIEAAHGPS